SASGCLVHGVQPFRSAACRGRPVGLLQAGGLGAVASPVVGLARARPGGARTATPAPAPTWLGLFAVRHPSDSSWHAKTHWGALASSGVRDCRLAAACSATTRAGDGPVWSRTSLIRQRRRRSRRP